MSAIRAAVAASSRSDLRDDVPLGIQQDVHIKVLP